MYRSSDLRTSGTSSRGQQDADEQNDHENTFPFIGRVVGHVRLYRERGGVGGQRETGTTKKSTRDQDCQQKPSVLMIKGRNPDTRINPVSKKNTFARRRLSTRQGTQGQPRGAPTPTPLNPHPSQVPPAAQVGNTSACGALEPSRGHWSESTRGVRWRSSPEGRRGIRRCWGVGD